MANSDDLIDKLGNNLVKLKQNPYLGIYFEQQNLEKYDSRYNRLSEQQCIRYLHQHCQFHRSPDQYHRRFCDGALHPLLHAKRWGKSSETSTPFASLPPSETEGKRILADMDQAISSFIQGQVLVSLCVGILTYIGYLIIGLDYSLILALVTMLTNVIPFIGPLIGAIPALIVGNHRLSLDGLESAHRNRSGPATRRKPHLAPSDGKNPQHPSSDDHPVIVGGRQLGWLPRLAAGGSHLCSPQGGGEPHLSPDPPPKPPQCGDS